MRFRRLGGMKTLRAVLATTLVALASSPLPALAYARDAGDDPGPGMSVLETVGIFVLLPMGIWGVIWLLWSIPKWSREAGPATGEQWNPQPSRDVVAK